MQLALEKNPSARQLAPKTQTTCSTDELRRALELGLGVWHGYVITSNSAQKIALFTSSFPGSPISNGRIDSSRASCIKLNILEMMGVRRDFKHDNIQQLKAN